MKISVVGGGRWVRTIAAVLGSMPGRTDRITVHSPRNSAGIEAWITQLGLDRRVTASAAWPACGADDDRPDAVIVANRAADHFTAAAAVLRAGVPVLVEKPVCLTQSKIEDLCKIADDNRGLFAASQVFLFARYFETFAASVAGLGKLRSLRFVWTDGAADVRHGEAKSYDSSVPVFDDVLPHIIPMIGQLKFRDLQLGSLDVQRGGARIAVEAQSEGLPVSLIIARNDESRQRRIEVTAETGQATLDFSNEPGLIDVSGVLENGDPLWNSAPRPLATMLSAFIAAVEGAPPDARLSPKGAIAAAGFADVIRGRYFAHQADWFNKRLGQPLDSSLRYALMELAGVTDRTADTVMNEWTAIDSRSRLQSFMAKGSPYPWQTVTNSS